jgi:hypothetical protein
MSKETVDAAAGEASAAGLMSRRETLKDIGRFAAVTAPAMLVLIEALPAAACVDSGNKTGFAKNGKRSVV